jgi:hypothetical protein
VFVEAAERSAIGFQAAKRASPALQAAKRPIVDFQAAKRPIADSQAAKRPIVDFQAAKRPIADSQAAKRPIVNSQGREPLGRVAHQPVSPERAAETQGDRGFFMPSKETTDRKSDLKWCEGICLAEDSSGTSKHDAAPSWRQTRLRFTGVYCSGIVSGMGWGIMFLAWPMHLECVRSSVIVIGIVACAFEAIGHEFGRQSQRDWREGRFVVVEPDQTKWTWRDRARLWLMGEYCAGIISGIGLGIVVLICMPADLLGDHRWVLAVMLGLALVILGSGMSRFFAERQTDADHRQIKHT